MRLIVFIFIFSSNLFAHANDEIKTGLTSLSDVANVGVPASAPCPSCLGNQEIKLVKKEIECLECSTDKLKKELADKSVASTVKSSCLLLGYCLESVSIVNINDNGFMHQLALLPDLFLGNESYQINPVKHVSEDIDTFKDNRFSFGLSGELELKNPSNGVRFSVGGLTNVFTNNNVGGFKKYTNNELAAKYSELDKRVDKTSPYSEANQKIYQEMQKVRDQYEQEAKEYFDSTIKDGQGSEPMISTYGDNYLKIYRYDSYDKVAQRELKDTPEEDVYPTLMLEIDQIDTKVNVPVQSEIMDKHNAVLSLTGQMSAQYATDTPLVGGKLQQYWHYIARMLNRRTPLSVGAPNYRYMKHSDDQYSGVLLAGVAVDNFEALFSKLSCQAKVGATTSGKLAYFLDGKIEVGLGKSGTGFILAGETIRDDFGGYKKASFDFYFSEIDFTFGKDRSAVYNYPSHGLNFLTKLAVLKLPGQEKTAFGLDLRKDDGARTVHREGKWQLVYRVKADFPIGSKK